MTDKTISRGTLALLGIILSAVLIILLWHFGFDRTEDTSSQESEPDQMEFEKPLSNDYVTIVDENGRVIEMYDREELIQQSVYSKDIKKLTIPVREEIDEVKNFTLNMHATQNSMHGKNHLRIPKMTVKHKHFITITAEDGQSLDIFDRIMVSTNNGG